MRYCVRLTNYEEASEFQRRCVDEVWDKHLADAKRQPHADVRKVCMGRVNGVRAGISRYATLGSVQRRSPESVHVV